MSNPTAERISDALGIPNAPEALSVPAVIVDLPPTVDDAGERASVNADFECARANTYKTIEKAQSALDGVLALAHTSESPRAFEVVATLINTINDANKGLLELQEKRKKLLQTATPSGNSDGDTNTTNNILFAGSSKDLFDLMRSQGIGNGARPAIVHNDN